MHIDFARVDLLFSTDGSHRGDRRARKQTVVTQTVVTSKKDADQPDAGAVIRVW